MRFPTNGKTNHPSSLDEKAALIGLLDGTFKIFFAFFINIHKQQGLFHYVEDEFLTDDILFKLMK